MVHELFSDSTTSITVEQTDITLTAAAVETMAAAEDHSQAQDQKFDLAE